MISSFVLPPAPQFPCLRVLLSADAVNHFNFSQFAWREALLLVVSIPVSTGAVNVGVEHPG